MTEVTNQKPQKFASLRTRLEKSIENKEFYEAHQLCKNLFSRLSKVDHLEAIKVLENVAHFLLINKQYESGSDLAMQLVKFLSEKDYSIDDDCIFKLKMFYSNMNQKSDERKSYIQACQKLLENKKNEGLFYNWIGVILWNEKNFTEARYHFIKSGNGVHIGLFILQFSSLYGYPTEKELFIVQAVLQLLCLKKIEAAVKAYSIYVKSTTDFSDGPPYKNFPLLNFIWLLILAIRSHRSQTEYKSLRDNYKEHLKQDPSFGDYLNKIGQDYFGITPPPNQRSFLDNIFNAFLNTGGSNSLTDNFTNSGSMNFLEDGAFSVEDEMD